MKKTDKELADELDAQSRLKRKGYRQRPCVNLNCAKDRIRGMRCLTCGGKGYTWEAPLMR